jgi:hypothetical protein
VGVEWNCGARARVGEERGKERKGEEGVGGEGGGEVGGGDWPRGRAVLGRSPRHAAGRVRVALDIICRVRAPRFLLASRHPGHTCCAPTRPHVDRRDA